MKETFKIKCESGDIGEKKIIIIRRPIFSGLLI